MSLNENPGNFSINSFLKNAFTSNVPVYIIKWLLISSVIAVFAGSMSALFLTLLDLATDYREQHIWIIATLPVTGFVIGLLYQYLGKETEKGNNLILLQIQDPAQLIPFRMAPLVLATTILTHLSGGSAGREGTAVQMGGSIADQLTRFFRFSKSDRVIILICGISAGFASVFGTPLAGMIFSLEVAVIGRMRYKAIFPTMLAALFADLVCDAWHVKHTVYLLDSIPALSPQNILYCILAGLACGLTARSFSLLTHFIVNFLKSKISYAPLRPVIGGLVVVAGVFLLGTTKYIGLGIPVIVSSFHEQLPVWDFALKLLFTAITIGASFKGGEVTPLFFIGATLGNALSLLIPLPIPLLAGLGFVAVFAGAANTPVATTIMAIELFEAEIGAYAAVTCVTAYLISGKLGIYTAQTIEEGKLEEF